MRFLAAIYGVCMGLCLSGGIFLLATGSVIQAVCGLAIIASCVFDIIGFHRVFGWRL